MDEKTEFLLNRAREEAVRAINSESEAAAEAHQNMALRYSTKALLSLTGEDEPEEPARPQ